MRDIVRQTSSYTPPTAAGTGRDAQSPPKAQNLQSAKDAASSQTAPSPNAHGAGAGREPSDEVSLSPEAMRALREEERGDAVSPQEDPTDAGGRPSAENPWGSGKDMEEVLQAMRERQALEDLDHYADVYDNPGGGDPDGIISTGDLDDIARGDYDREAAIRRLVDLGVPEARVDRTLERMGRSAQYMLDNEEFRNQIDVANDFGGDPDGDIARSDLSRAVFQRELQLSRQGALLPGQAAANRDSYDTVDTSNAERSAQAIQSQERQILEAVNSGQPISFTNANGQTEELTVRQMGNTGGATVYEITGADGHTLRIESELGGSENRVALARIADYYTQVPPELRDTVSSFELHRKPDETAAATYFSSNDHVEFYDGLEHLNEEVFNHEYAHGIGFDRDGLGEGVLDQIGQFFTGRDGEGTPGGWDDAVEADGRSISSYGDTARKEDFAESWAAYMEARENGPEALKRFEEAFPARYAILDGLYEEAMG